MAPLGRHSSVGTSVAMPTFEFKAMGEQILLCYIKHDFPNTNTVQGISDHIYESSEYCTVHVNKKDTFYTKII